MFQLSPPSQILLSLQRPISLPNSQISLKLLPSIENTGSFIFTLFILLASSPLWGKKLPLLFKSLPSGLYVLIKPLQSYSMLFIIYSVWWLWKFDLIINLLVLETVFPWSEWSIAFLLFWPLQALSSLCTSPHCRCFPAFLPPLFSH